MLADSPLVGCVSPHKARYGCLSVALTSVVVHSRQGREIHRFLVLRTIGRILMNLPS
jgi:hypothetical protein